jgi:hypothetical protein
LLQTFYSIRSVPAGDLQHRPGSQFTRAAFTGMLTAGAHLNGRPRPLDGQRLIERLWRSLKHEDIYLKSYVDGREATAVSRRGLRRLATGRPGGVA